MQARFFGTPETGSLGAKLTDPRMSRSCHLLVRKSASRSALRPGRLEGVEVGPGWETVVPTRICMTCSSCGAGLDTGFRAGDSSRQAAHPGIC